MSSSSSITTEGGDAVHANVILRPSVRFNPTDELLVSYYLRSKIQGTDSLFRHTIPEIDVCKYEPCDLPAFFPEVHENEWFFFTRPKYKDIDKTRRDRATDQGFYKSTGDEREIRAEESESVIGKKRFLTFHEGRGLKAKKTDWVIHEFKETEVGSFVLCLLKNRSPSYKKPKGDPFCGKLADSGANSEDNQAAVSDVIPEPVEHLGYKGRGDVNSSESPDGSRLIDSNNILSFDDGDDETGDWKFPDLDDPAAFARFLELRAEMEEILNSPPQTPHQTPQDYLSSTFLSSGNIQLGAVLQANGTSDDCNTIQSPFGDNNYSYTDKNDISTCDKGEPHSFTVFDFENKAADDTSQEPCVQPEKYLGGVLHADICDNGYNNCQPTCGDKDSYLKSISTNDKHKQFSSIASNFENQTTNKRKR
ncbi:protein NTM1-like 9 isoform X6 [Malus sylvestris]|uniref:protein NTM1-like 9 isoform X5 n=1 Tax=Malus sylvestris TaxID=3752 RepID=UPI0021ACB8A1|nr:protein NTM1-like 9 isoform X5 [Malus sylvestris]XP_050142159.1 protein NTM1-like 9 isoform X6 [Malus sylvestris]